MNPQEVRILLDDGVSQCEIRRRADMWSSMEKVVEQADTLQQRMHALQLFNKGCPDQEMGQRLELRTTNGRKDDREINRGFVQRNKMRIARVIPGRKQMLELSSEGWGTHIPKRTGVRKGAVQRGAEDAENIVHRKQHGFPTTGQDLFDNFFGGAYHLSNISNKTGIPIDTIRQTLLYGKRKLSVENASKPCAILADECMPMLEMWEIEHEIFCQTNTNDAHKYRCAVMLAIYPGTMRTAF